MLTDPAEPIYTVALICERGLIDTDGVFSAIRLVDVFFVDPSSEVPPEKRPIGIHLYFVAKFQPDDESEHVAAVYLARPNEGRVELGVTDPTKAGTKYEKALKTLNVYLRFGVFPKVLGLHYIEIELDGRRITRLPFTLVPRPTQATSE